MSQHAEVVSLAMALPVDVRASLAHQLIMSLEREREESKESFEELIVVRQQRIDSGNYQSFEPEETLDRIKNSLDQRKPQ